MVCCVISSRNWGAKWASGNPGNWRAFPEVGPESLDLVIFFFFLREVKNLDFHIKSLNFKILAIYLG